ncbi:hypothetical protein [Desulfosporosinus fructosivorans]
MTTEDLLLDAEKKALAGESLPRDTIIEWNGFDIQRARAWFEESGYHHGT